MDMLHLRTPGTTHRYITIVVVALLSACGSQTALETDGENLEQPVGDSYGEVADLSEPGCAAVSGATPTASKDDGNVAANVLDGSLDTRWSGFGKGTWIQLDLGRTQPLCRVAVAWFRGNERVNNFVISISTDGTQFTTIHTGQSTGSTLQFESYDFALKRARYVRITVNGNTRNDWASMTELRAFRAEPISLIGITEGQSLTEPVRLRAEVAAALTSPKVAFYVDGVLNNTEGARPFCLNGDDGSVCHPFDVSALAPGPHKFLARVTAAEGTFEASVSGTVPTTTTTESAPAPAPGTSTTAAPGSCSSISQHGVTFRFDATYPCGTFANGDFWVTPRTGGTDVVVTSISPDASAGSNGWMANPSSRSNHAYDSRIGGYDATLMPTLPYRARGGESLVKGVSNTLACGQTSGHPPCLTTAVVLTVLESVPADGGLTVFRPPYFGTYKPLISTRSIRTDLLPRLAPVSGAPSLEQVRARYARVQLDHKSSWQNRYMHPVENFRSYNGTTISNYGSNLGKDNNDAALRLMLNETAEEKMPALINYLQAGIDWYGTSRGGVTYHPDGGHNLGRKIVIAFAGVILDHSDIKAVAGATGDNMFAENGHVYFSAKAGRPLYGQTCTSGMYEKVLAGGSGSRDCRDPLEEIDGGEIPGAAYQKCCTAKPFKGSSLAIRLLPGGKSVWNADHFHEYVDRWVNFGAWTLPDSQARFVDRHGTGADSGYYGTSFQAAMWNAYRKTF